MTTTTARIESTGLGDSLLKLDECQQVEVLCLASRPGVKVRTWKDAGCTEEVWLTVDEALALAAAITDAAVKSQQFATVVAGVKGGRK